MAPRRSDILRICKRKADLLMLSGLERIGVTGDGGWTEEKSKGRQMVQRGRDWRT